MTDNQGMLPPAGWYPDPFGAPHERWWDGTQWTDHTNVPAPPVVTPPAPAYVPPTYVEPTPVEPVVVEQPIYEQPTYEQPAFTQPAYEEPAFTQPSYEEPAYTPPAFEEPKFDEPKYEPAAYEPATYDPVTYDQSAYDQPAAQQRTADPDHAFEFGLLVSGANGSTAPASGASAGNEDFGDWAGSEYVEPTRNTPATAGLTFGILSFVLPVLGGALGLVFSVIGLNRAGQFDQAGEGPIGRGKAIAGLVLSIIGSVVSVAFLIFGLPGVLASLQAAPLIPTGSDQAVDGTQLTANGNIPLELGATGTFTPVGADAPSLQFTVSDIVVDTSCAAVVPVNGQFLAVTMELTTSADYQTTTTGGGSLHVNASDWTTYLPDGNLIVNTDNGTECVTEDKAFPLEIAPGSTVTGTVFVDTSAETTAISWHASEVVSDDPASTHWEWAIPR